MNFILVQYKRQWTGDLELYYHNSWAQFDLMIRQINYFYSKPSIHVLTNARLEARRNVTYHVEDDVEQTNYAKLLIYGLLDEPAMYVDNDIVIKRPFESEHMPDVSFNIFQKYGLDYTPTTPSGLQAELPEWIRSCGYPHYNTGVVWIGRPTDNVARDLAVYKSKFRIHESGWANDEYVISHYISKHQLNMLLIPEVNQFRRLVDSQEKRAACQSVHYTGNDFKDCLFHEYLEDLKVI